MGVAAAIGGSAVLGAYMTNKSGKRSADAANNAANIAAQGQSEALDYQKEVEALPLEMRNKFLPQLGDIAQGGQGQQNLIDSAMNSPLYKQMIGNIEGSQPFAEEAILRNASATGGLRSGTANENLARLQFQQQNDKNAALTQTYGQQLQGIQGLAGIPLNTNAIAKGIAAPSATQAQGITAGAQSRADSTQGMMDLTSNLAGAAISKYSDIRAKENIRYIGTNNGHKWYSWNWNKAAEKLGLTGESEGVMAHEVHEYMPEAVDTSRGLLMVNYKMLGVQ